MNANHPAVIFIYGATGDLTKRKLLPALYKLFEQKHIDEEHNPILCLGRRELSREEFIEQCQLGSFIPKAKPNLLEAFTKLIHYNAINFDHCIKGDCADCPSCTIQSEALADIQKKYDTKGNRIFYFATPPSLFETLSIMIERCGLLNGRGYKRLAFEKPFGHDLKSARELNRTLAQRFREQQIYRIDHYLGKALVQDILTFRFANRAFFDLWDNTIVDNVQITVAETLGVEDRGGYYDKAGAIRDMLQNHLMEVFALIAMEMPKNATADAIRDEKTKIIRALSKPRAEDLVTGQYRSVLTADGSIEPGYREEHGVDPHSRTETFAALRAQVNTRRWRGVPFYLRTGKRLRTAFAEVNIQLKPAVSPLFNSGRVPPSNIISIRIQPDTGIGLTFNTNDPGQKGKLTPVVMDFCHHCLFAMNTPEAYEAIFQAILTGDQSVFTRWDTVEASWKYIDQVLALSTKTLPSPYEPRSSGPAKADALLKKDKRAWLNIQAHPFEATR